MAAAALVAAGAGLSAGAASAGCTFNLKAELPVTLRGLRPITPVKVNGAELDFLVDSGAFFSIIVPSTAADLKLKPAYARGELSGVGGTRELQVVDADTFSVGGRNLRDVQFVVSGDLGPGVSGVIGQNLLIAGDIDYDFAGGKVRIMSPQDCGDAPLAYWAAGKPFNAMTVTPVRPGHGFTTGMVSINGRQVSVAFDTGASTSILKLEAARRLGLGPEMEGARDAGFSRGIGPRLVRTWIVPVADFRIADEEVRNTHLRIGDTAVGDFDMLLGADFFRSHHMLISNSQRRLYFTYNGGPVFDLNPGAAAPLPSSAPSPAPAPAVR